MSGFGRSQGGTRRKEALVASEPLQEFTRRTPNGQLATAIANRLVKIVSEYTGRGPTRARVHMDGDLVACVFGDTLTKGERRLVERGEADTVLRTRRTYQSLMSADVKAAVEELTGRRVIAFFSDNHVDPDMGIEAVVLAPLDSPNGGRHDHSDGHGANSSDGHGANSSDGHGANSSDGHGANALDGGPAV
jgi:uncharacterized protein YbcI